MDALVPGEVCKPAFDHGDEVRLFLRMLDGEDERMGFLSFDVTDLCG